MKWFVMVACLVVLTGCANRTGTVCIAPTTTVKIDNQNPVDIKQDTIDAVAGKVAPVLKEYVEYYTKMTVSGDCDKSTYKLITNIDEINTGSANVLLLGGNGSDRRFELIVSGGLIDTKRQTEVLHFKKIREDGDLRFALKGVSREIAKLINVKTSDEP